MLLLCEIKRAPVFSALIRTRNLMTVSCHQRRGSPHWALLADGLKVNDVRINLAAIIDDVAGDEAGNQAQNNPADMQVIFPSYIG
jgi:hypothetical protein